MALLEDGPLFEVKTLRKANVGILITGNEIFHGLIEDKFEALVTAKIRTYDCTAKRTIIVPDDTDAVADAVAELQDAGCDLIITTAGLSVDPDDVTRQGLLKAGVADMLHGLPVLPGAMTLVARKDSMQVMGVPACALFYKTTSLDILLPSSSGQRSNRTQTFRQTRRRRHVPRMLCLHLPQVQLREVAHACPRP